MDNAVDCVKLDASVARPLSGDNDGVLCGGETMLRKYAVSGTKTDDKIANPKSPRNTAARLKLSLNTPLQVEIQEVVKRPGTAGNASKPLRLIPT